MPIAQKWAALALAGLTVVAAPGCGSKTSGSNSAVGCQSYVDSYCALEARCNVTGAASCSASFDALVCVASNEPARCAAALDDWTACDTVPAGCGVEKIANLAQAQATCVQFVSRACTYYLRCGKYPDQASCADDLKASKEVDDTVPVWLTPSRYAGGLRVGMTAAVGCTPMPLSIVLAEAF